VLELGAGSASGSRELDLGAGAKSWILSRSYNRSNKLKLFELELGDGSRSWNKKLELELKLGARARSWSQELEFDAGTRS